jgi:hypothetical protein
MPDDYTYLTQEQKQRFILSNYILFDDVDKLKDIMDTWNVDPKEFDVAFEDYWESLDWWNDKAFLEALSTVGVDIDKKITVKYFENMVIVKKQIRLI